jgi:hypothetical protein
VGVPVRSIGEVGLCAPAAPVLVTDAASAMAAAAVVPDAPVTSRELSPALGADPWIEVVVVVAVVVVVEVAPLALGRPASRAASAG